jgi:hypothetical protein
VRWKAAETGPTDLEVAAEVSDTIEVTDDEGRVVAWDESEPHACDDACASRGHITSW